MIRPSVVCLAILSAAFFPMQQRAARADQFVDASVAAFQARSSIVLVHGNEWGTGFSIAQRGNQTYILTAAHLIDEDRYRANATLPDDNFSKLDSAEWLKVIAPQDGVPLSGVLVGDPDFNRDVAVVRVANMQHVPRALCLASSVPFVRAGQYGEASFTLSILDDPPADGAVFSSQVKDVTGSSSPALLPGNQEFEYNIEHEQGFSGAPLFNYEDGRVFGMVRRVPMVLNSSGDGYVPSTATRDAVSAEALETVLTNAATSDPLLKSAIDESLGPMADRSYPDLRFGDAIRYIALDEFHGDAGEGTPNANFLAPGFVPYETRLRALLGQRFGASGESEAGYGVSARIIDDDTPVFAPGTDLTRIHHLCIGPNGARAHGVFVIQRWVTRPPHSDKILHTRIGLADCQGDILVTADIAPSTIGATSPNHAEVQDFINHVSDALDTLSSGNPQRLTNFGFSGVLIGDTEMRGFYRVRHDKTQNLTYLTYGWRFGASVRPSGVTHDVELPGLPGYQGDVATLNGDQLEAFINQHDGVFEASLLEPATSTPRVYSLATKDSCYYYRRDAVDGNNDYLSSTERRKGDGILCLNATCSQ